MEEESSPNSSIWHSKLVPPVAAILAIYIVMRLITNYNSWSDTDHLTAGFEENQIQAAHQAGDDYNQMLANSSQRDTQIQTLWRLIQVPQWHLPHETEIGDAPDLAKELQKRAISNYQANNMGQAASNIKILLTWSVRIYDSTGGGNGGMQLQLGSTIAKTALDTLQQCPVILQYPAIRQILEELRIAIENEAENHFKRELGAYVGKRDAAEKNRGLTLGQKLFASQRRLNELIEAYLKGQFNTKNRPAHLRMVQLKSLFQCPLTMSLFKKSLKPLEEQAGVSSALLAQIKKIQSMKASPETAPLSG